MAKIEIEKYNNIVILTGAGISVASGLKTYRGKENSEKIIDINRLAHVDRLKDNPKAVWQAFNALRKECQIAKPNQAHITLANLEQQIKAKQKFTLITQNIDRLHDRAGSKNVIELHGRIDRTCCSNDRCSLQPFFDDKIYTTDPPLCPQCNSPLRPTVVLFGEPIPLDAEWQAKKLLRDCDLFVAIGTSGTVFPAANYVRSAEYVGARTILINLEPMNPPNPYFKEEYIGKAEEILPILFH